MNCGWTKGVQDFHRSSTTRPGQDETDRQQGAGALNCDKSQHDPRGRPLPPWAAEIDCASWAQFFLKFVLAHPALTAVIPGTDRPEYALDNLNAARGRIPDARMRERIVIYWDQLG